MPDTARLFVAAPLPNALKAYLTQARQAYDHLGVRLVPEQNLHLTLYFIGNVPAAEVPIIRQTLAQVAKKHRPFTLELAQLEPGPKPTNARLIWARFKPQQAFTQLSQDLTHVLSATPPKQEKFIPHVTLCRFRKDMAIPRQLPIITPSEQIHFPVTSFALWQSELASPHPLYTVVEEFPLGKGN